MDRILLPLLAWFTHALLSLYLMLMRLSSRPLSDGSSFMMSDGMLQFVRFASWVNQVFVLRRPAFALGFPRTLEYRSILYYFQMRILDSDSSYVRTALLIYARVNINEAWHHESRYEYRTTEDMREESSSRTSRRILALTSVCLSPRLQFTDSKLCAY
jgi:hypothetical protein